MLNIVDCILWICPLLLNNKVINFIKHLIYVNQIFFVYTIVLGKSAVCIYIVNNKLIKYENNCQFVKIPSIYLRVYQTLNNKVFFFLFWLKYFC